MAKIPSTASEFHIRPGVAPLEDAGWAGVNTEDDPISLRANELQRGQNLRRQGKILKSRPGLVQKIDLATVAGFSPGAVMWMKEAPITGTPLNLWASSLGVYGATPDEGASILRLESTAVPMEHRYAAFTAAADRQIPLASYGSRLIIGDGSVLRELIRIVHYPGPGTDVALRIPTAPTAILAQIPGYAIRCLLEFDGKLFVGLENLTTAASSKIAVWDGMQLTDDITSVRPPLALGIWRDKLVAGFDATAANIRVRNRGVAPGTWNTFALAGSLCATQGNAMQEFGPYLYIASGADKIFKFDGAALTLVHTITDCATNGRGVTSLVLHNDLLYYGWNAITTYVASLGRHDPDSTATEWVDSYRVLATGATALFNTISALASYRGRIACGGYGRGIISTGAFVGDTPIAIALGSAAGFNILQFLRF
jgi:hypothetical protein